MMKRYLLFVGAYYYPSGGWDDFVASYNTVAEALAASGALSEYSWRQVVDTETQEEVELPKEAMAR